MTFPAAITISFVEIGSNLKTPGARGFIDINDYSHYITQKEQLNPYYTELELIKNTFYNENVFTNENTKYENMKKIINDIKVIKEGQTKFILYNLLKGSWSKSLI
jgi:hypothetical protein